VDAGVARGWLSQLERQKGNTSLDVPLAALLAVPDKGAPPPQPLPNGRKLGDRKTR
jgi:hypothetical protein